jgi:hypothetical protein
MAKFYSFIYGIMSNEIWQCCKSKFEEYLKKRFMSIMISGIIVIGMSAVSLTYAFICSCIEKEDNWNFLTFFSS